VLKNVAGQVGRGCFAIGACNSYALERAVGVLKKCCTDIGHGYPCVRDNDNRARAVRNLFFGESGNSTSLCGSLDEGGAIGVFPRQCKEKRAWNSLSGVEAK
jgi:hypothetical protein